MTTTDSGESLDEKFTEFLRSYYHDEIGEVAQNLSHNNRSLEIDYMDLFRYDPDIADDYRNRPKYMRKHLEGALHRHELPIEADLGEVNVRVKNVPDVHAYDVGEYRSQTIGEYIAVNGQIQKQTDVHPKPITAAFECKRCGTITEIPQPDGDFQEPHECSGCERQGPFKLNHGRTDWTDFQLIRLQLPPEKAKGGASPTIDVFVRDDIVGKPQAGDRVRVSGQMTVDPESNGHAFEPQIRGEHVEINQTDYENINIDQHLEAIHEIVSGERGDPYELLMNSIGPDIEGMDTIKEALALQLFGGVRCEYPDGRYDRGDPHVLLLGDPGTAKSTLLKDVEKKAPRSTYASGKGATAAGMTAAAVADDFGDQEYTLEAGALVEADKGIACVDEIDKVKDDARASMHEALSHQTVHINKAGINAHLPTRTALLAAGNPEYGRFRDDKPIAQQIDLGPTLLSRFDLMFMIDDTPEAERDAEIIEGMIKTRRAAAMYTDRGDKVDELDHIDPAITTEVLRAWIAHAKQSVTPWVEDPEVADDLKNSFHNLRQVNGGEDGPVPVTFRKLQGIMRLAEASARIRLSETVEHKDIDRARRLIGRSMRDVGMDPDGDVIDADIIETGTAESQKDKIEWVSQTIRKEADADPVGHEMLIDLGEDADLSRGDVEYAIEKLKRQGKIYEPESEHYRIS